MTRHASYLIVIARNGDGYTATALAFPNIAAHGRGARQAYAQLKLLIRTSLAAALAEGQPIPRDPVVRTRSLRLDLESLREQEDLK